MISHINKRIGHHSKLDFSFKNKIINHKNNHDFIVNQSNSQ